MKIKFSLLLFVLLSALTAQSKWNFKGQWIGSTTLSGTHKDFQFNGYTQYLPMLEYQPETRYLQFSLDAAGNFSTNFESDPKAKLYRLKLTLASPQTEFRLGLQKINFGPAQILRSLQWFDTMSPTDLLKLTDGVYGALFRHYFLNNNNIWLWSLYGNDSKKGIEIMETQKNTPELGGRTQLRALGGEVGLTGHHRQTLQGPENRLAVDGRWDAIIGSWFEALFQKNDDLQRVMVTIGMDYTFGLGNGLYLMGEHLYTKINFDGPGQSEIPQYSALMVAYPITLFDNFNALFYYSWESRELSQFLGWQRTYDHFLINLNLFHFPTISGDQQTLQGYGFEFKLIFNH